MEGLCIRLATVEDAPEIARIEDLCFPPDEKADYESICFRMRTANKYFYVLEEDSTEGETNNPSIIGFINGTVTTADTIHHESMGTHEEEGHCLIIHSVSIHPDHRHKKLGTNFLKQYVNRLLFQHDTGSHSTMYNDSYLKITKVLLMCKAALLGFYVNCGFHIVCLSPVLHGQERWFEMRLNLDARRNVPAFHLNAFATTAFRGNPATVLLHHFPHLGKDTETKLMLDLANEINTPITVFVSQLDGRNCYMEEAKGNSSVLVDNSIMHYRIRWFTPSGEVSLCGHGTLGAANVLFKSTNLVSCTKKIQFHTNNDDVLTVSYDAESGSETPFCMHFPAIPIIHVSNMDFLSMFAECFNINKKDVIQIASNIPAPGTIASKYLIEVTNDAYQQFQANKPTLNIKCLSKDVLGFVVTTAGTMTTTTIEYVNRYYEDKFNFVSSYFYRSDVNSFVEDFVTGSAHCMLTPYWTQKYQAPIEFCAHQSSKRGGILYVQLLNDNVVIKGSVTDIMTSSLHKELFM